jgi:hemerythrin-like domain-containing protein
MSKEEINKTLIPRVIQTIYPDLTEDEASSFAKMNINTTNSSNGEPQADKRFIRMAGQFVNIDDLHIDLIDQVNPFQRAYEILSKSVTPKVLKTIQDVIEATRIQVSEDEAILMWPKIKQFYATFNREPIINSTDPLEKRMSEVLIYIKDKKRKKQYGS